MPVSRTIQKSSGRGTTTHWNEMSAFERLKLILRYENLFLSWNLVTVTELEFARRLSPTEWEYILSREMHPLFFSIDLHQAVEHQSTAAQLKAALKAVFH